MGQPKKPAPRVGGGRPVGVARRRGRDDAERRAREAEERQREVEGRYTALVRATGERAWTATAAGEVEADNPDGSMFTGARAEHVTAPDWAAAIHSEDRPRALAAWRHAVANGTPYEDVHRVRRADGTYRTLLVRGAPVRDGEGHVREWVGVSADITERTEQERRLRWQAGMLERTHDAIVAWELGGPIVYWNRGAQLLYGYAAAEAVGRVSHELLQTVLPTGDAAFETSLARAGEWMGELTHTTRDGRVVEVLSRHQVLREPDGRALVVETARDITGRKRLERDLRALQALTDTALAHLGLDDLLRELLERVLEVMAVDNAAILLLDEDGRTLRIRAARGAEEEVAARVRVPLGQGFAGRIAAENAPLVVDDLSTFPVANPFLHERLRSALGVPLAVEGRVLGVVHVGTTVPRRFGERDVDVLQRVAARVALAIERAQLFELAQSRAAHLQATFDAMVDGVLVYDREEHIAHANVAARRLLAYESRPATYELAYSDGRPVPAEATPVKRLLRGEVLAGDHAEDYRVRALDGRELLLNLSGAPARDAGGRVVGAVVVARDVDERRRLERRTHDALEALLAMARALVEPEHGVADPGAPPVRAARGAVRRLAQLTCDVLDCRRVGIQAIERDTRLVRPLAVVGLTEEEEPRWWAEQEAQQVRYGEGAGEGLLARFEAGEPLVIDMRVPPYDRLPNPYGITTSLAVPMQVGSEMVGALSLDNGGEPHDFTAGDLALAHAVGQLAALVVERERLLDERARAEGRALALQTANEQMEAFLGMAGHELKTPVAVMQANLQMAARVVERRIGGASDAVGLARAVDEASKFLAHGNQGAHRMTRLVDELLDVSRIQAGKLEMEVGPADLAAIVRETAEGQRQTNPDRVILSAVPADLTVPVSADVDRFAQVVTNYLTNALRYAPPERPITVGLEVSGGQARAWVRDEGPGIATAERERIWERFQRVADTTVQGQAGHGLGLGLHICKSIVERHGGRVGVESEVGRGSTFWFSLPLAGAPAE